MRAILLGALLSFVGGAAFADDDFIVGDPNACHLKIEYEAKEQMLHLRPQLPSGTDCHATSDLVEQGLDTALTRYSTLPISLIFLGRLEHYPWLSEDLTEKAIAMSGPSGRWDAIKGHARDGNDNDFVSKALFLRLPVSAVGEFGERPLEPFVSVLAQLGYSVYAVSVEKVMLRSVTGREGHYPYDALVHVRVDKAP
ncbi:hypothetical protein [Dongia rigui]|uniref:Uncharacterized protein n=1 Tax=Dongia rigui TaxID=940149 RepID=A0ABU5E4E2_9PROT|nr:hypothetical protein [Dongia rigui]MDY0874466.1 hypothetical protein [Dongia rigui]